MIIGPTPGDAETVDMWPGWMPLSVREALRAALGITRLYAHQMEAIKALVEERKHVAIATATSR